MLRIDLDYIKKKNWKIENLFPEVWKFIYPFEERGSFKKEFKKKYERRINVDINKNYNYVSK